MMEHETREKAKSAVKLILEAAGFEVEDVEDPLDLSAVRDGEYVAVLCSADADTITEFDRTNYNIVIGGEQVPCKKLLFTLDNTIHTEHCIVWGVREFVRLSGEATLARVLDRELSLTLIPGAAVESAPGTTPEPVVTESSGVSIPHLPVKITQQNAERISGTQGAAILKFMPHWVYHYMSSGEQVYQDHHIPFDSEGWGAILSLIHISEPTRPY